MIVPIVSALCAIACVAASARRLLIVHHATEHDLEGLVVALRGDAGARRGAVVSRALAGEEGWEGAVARAIAMETPNVRVAEINEQLTELDFQLSRWSRVPRVCASLSSSAGFLLAAVLLREGLSDPSALSGDVGELVTSGLVGQALTVVGLGLAGAVACAALKARADRAARDGSRAADELVDRLEELAARARGASAGSRAGVAEGNSEDADEADEADAVEA